ncbi:MAG: CinA family protein [Deltaproteobacteria bacterium]|nr:CinA family protein [Deltaproteobacteria bacterium]MBI3755066.1 CinA family protein [Deltaproteobacteria bacterium]
MKKYKEVSEEAVACLFKRLKLTLSVAESCSGGLLCHKITNVPGSSKYFRGGIIAYDNEVKKEMLGVSERILNKCGAVSKETASAMAHSIRRIMAADIGLAITGIAGPTGGTKVKPVGTVFIGISAKTKNTCRHFVFKGNRRTIKLSASNKALNMLREFLE